MTRCEFRSTCLQKASLVVSLLQSLECWVLCQTTVQPFSQKPRTPTVAPLSQISLYGVAEADLSEWCNSWRARFLRERLFKCDPCKTLLQTTCIENRATGYCEGGAYKFFKSKPCSFAPCVRSRFEEHCACPGSGGACGPRLVWRGAPRHSERQLKVVQINMKVSTTFQKLVKSALVWSSAVVMRTGSESGHLHFLRGRRGRIVDVLVRTPPPMSRGRDAVGSEPACAPAAARRAPPLRRAAQPPAATVGRPWRGATLSTTRSVDHALRGGGWDGVGDG